MEKEGVTFSTTSDSEVVLQSFIKWGEKCVDRFNGRFAFAVWNNKREELFVFRDRLGIKPLYYAWDEKTLYFASELKAIAPSIDKTNWDQDAIQQYFRLGYIPAPKTIYAAVQKLEEGTYLQLNNSHFLVKNYWKLEENVEKDTILDEKDAKTQYHELLKNSVEMRLQSDVPFGVFLSGGIDSSTIAAVAQSISKDPISTFSIGFEETDFNESEWSKKVSQELGTKHHEYILSHRDAQNLIEEMPRWYDEPFADTSAIPTYLVSKMARKEVKMVLTGDGGDEQFMGYGMYTWADRLAHPRNRFLRPLIKNALKWSPKENHNRASAYFDFSKHEMLTDHIFSVDQQLFSAPQLKHYFSFDENVAISQIGTVQRKLSAAEQQALFDLKYYLPGDLLTKVDRATMQNGIEARTPLLDHNLIEFTLNLDESLKRKEGDSKYLLKQVLYEYLPPALFDRPKWGFGIPLKKWLANELRPLLEKHVNREVLSQYSFYNTEEILQLKKEFLNAAPACLPAGTAGGQGKSYHFNKLWLIISFQMWVEEQETG